MFKIIFSDIDGTLLNENRELSATTIETVKKLKHKIPFILISSRMPAAMRHLQQDLGIEGDPFISYNGGLIIANGKVISSTEIPIETFEHLQDFSKNSEIHLSLYNNDEWFAPKDDFWTQREINNTKVKPKILSNKDASEMWKEQSKGLHKIMAMGEENEVSAVEHFLAMHYENDLHMYRSKSTYLEIAPKKISKLTAIQHLLDHHYQIPLTQSLAFGDNYNDIEMLRGVGMGIAVGNAKPEVMEAAQHIAEPGKEDGVAKMISQIMKV